MPRESRDAGAVDGRTGERKWVELRPARNFAARLYGGAIAAVLWILLVLAVAWPMHLGAAGKVAAGVLLLAAALPIVYAVRALLVFRNLEDGKLWVDRNELVLGRPFQFRVEQRTRRGVLVHDMRVALVCLETAPHRAADGKQATKTVVRLEKWETITREKTTDSAKRLAATRTFKIPPDQLASSPVGDKTPPVIQWKLRLVTSMANAPAYDVDYPITVRATPSPSSMDDWSADLA